MIQSSAGRIYSTKPAEYKLNLGEVGKNQTELNCITEEWALH